MKASKQWLPVIAGLIVTPFTLLLAIASAGAGHGDYFWAKVFYPYTMLSGIALKSITIPFMVVAVLQLPTYGVFLRHRLGQRQTKDRQHRIFVFAYLSGNRLLRHPV